EPSLRRNADRRRLLRRTTNRWRFVGLPEPVRRPHRAAFIRRRAVLLLGLIRRAVPEPEGFVRQRGRLLRRTTPEPRSSRPLLGLLRLPIRSATADRRGSVTALRLILLPAFGAAADRCRSLPLRGVTGRPDCRT